MKRKRKGWRGGEVDLDQGFFRKADDNNSIHSSTSQLPEDIDEEDKL